MNIQSQIALVLIGALVLGCGNPDNESGTSNSTDDSSSAGTSSSGASGTDSAGTDSASTGSAGTDSAGTGSTGTGSAGTEAPTTSGPNGGCEALCQHGAECGVAGSIEQCIAMCGAADETVQTCLAGCDQDLCVDWLMCTTVCGVGGEPGGDPYGSDPRACGDIAAGVTCPPEVSLCAVAVFGDVKESVCTPFCGPDNSCPIPATGTAVPVCGLQDTPPDCTLDCSNGETCPDGMVCSLGSDTCMWNVP